MARWTLAELLDLEAAIARDGARAALSGGDERALAARDRRIAEEIELGATDREQRLAAWLAAVRRADRDLPGRRLAGWWSLIRAAVILLGALIGLGLAAAVFRYHGDEPIALLPAILLVIVIPFATWVVSLILQGLSGAGWIGPASDPLRWLFSRLAMVVGDRCLRRDEPPGWVGRFADAARRRSGGRLVIAPLARGLLAILAQWFGIALTVAAATWLLIAAATTDLAFAWGTSLAMSEDRLLAILQAIAAPWSGLWPAAVPDADLLAASRYVRLEDRFSGGDQVRRAADAAALATWWRFCFAGILTWGLVPRLLTLAVMSALTRRRIAGLAVQDEPGRRRVLDRLAGRRTLSAAAPAAPAVSDAPHESERLLPTGSVVVVGWDGAERDPGFAAHLAGQGLAASGTLQAGSGVAADDDLAAIEGVAASPAAGVLLAVPADEQPVADLAAFVRELRTAAGPRPLAIAVCGGRDPVVADAWRRTLEVLQPRPPIAWWESPR